MVKSDGSVIDTLFQFLEHESVNIVKFLNSMSWHYHYFSELTLRWLLWLQNDDENGGGISTFSQNYRCYPVSFIEKV